MAADVGRLSRGAANHRDAAIASVCGTFRSLPALTRPSVASDRIALALPRDHYCVRARARSGSTAPVFLPRSHDDRCADRDRFFQGRAHSVVQTGPVALPTRRSPAVLPTNWRPIVLY